MIRGVGTDHGANLLRRLRPLSAAAAATAVALVLTSCGGGSDSGDNGDGGNGEQASATENEINPVDRGDLADGGDLRWPLGEIPPNFNYNQFDGTLDDNSDVMLALMPSAFEFSADATPSVNADYFENIELTSDDPQQITYDINADATWSDGTPITAEDLIAQWEALNGTNAEYNISSTTGYDQIESVEQGDSEKQAVVTFKNPYADWQALYSPLYPASTNSDPNVFNTGWIEQPQVTAGPFQLGSIDTTAQTITLERNPDWWGDPAILDRIIYRVIAEQPPARPGDRGHRDPPRRWAELPAHHDQRHLPGAVRRRRPPRAGQGDRPADHRRRHDRPAGWRLDQARQPHLHAEPGGLPGQCR